MNQGTNDKAEKLEAVRRLFLVNRDLKASQVADILDIQLRGAHRYVDELKGSLTEAERHGAYIYTPTADEIEMSVLILRRALEQENVTEDMIELARVINHHHAAV